MDFGSSLQRYNSHQVDWGYTTSSNNQDGEQLQSSQYMSRHGQVAFEEEATISGDKVEVNGVGNS